MDRLVRRAAEGMAGGHDLGRVQHRPEVGVEQPPVRAGPPQRRLVDHLRGERHPRDARPARVPHDVADDEVGGAVVDVADLGQVLSQVGGLGVPPDQLLAQPLRIDLQRAHDTAHQVGDPQGQIQRSGHLAVGEDEVVAARRGALGDGEEAGEPPDEHPGCAPHDGQRVRVALLRHQHARPAVAVVQVDEVELAAGEDLQVLGELALVGDHARAGREHRDQVVDPPHGVAGVRDDAVEAERPGQCAAVVLQPGAVHAARPARARVDLGELGEQAVGVAECRLGEGEQVVAERGGLRLLQIGLVGHQGLRVPARLAHRLLDEPGRREDEVGDLGPQVQAQRDPGRLPPGTAGVQPAGRVAEALDEEPFPGVVGLTERRVVREVRRLGPVGLQEQGQQSALGVLRDDPALGQVEDVRHVGQVVAAVQDRGVGVLQRETRRDQLRGRRGLRSAAAPPRDGVRRRPGHGRPPDATR
jgi:hypothetical protein